jgi:hypothetical protein
MVLDKSKNIHENWTTKMDSKKSTLPDVKLFQILKIVVTGPMTMILQIWVFLH